MKYKIRVTLKDDVISPRRTIDNDGIELDEAVAKSGSWLANVTWLTLDGVNSSVMIPIANIAFIELIRYPQKATP